MEDLGSKLSATLQMECEGLRRQNNDISDEIQLLGFTVSQTMEKVEYLSGEPGGFSYLVQDKKMERQRTELAAHASSLGKLIEQLKTFKSLVEALPMENRVLRRLHFPSILHREGNIERPASGTYSWVVKEMGQGQGQPTLSSKSISAPLVMTTEDIRRQAASNELQQFLAGNHSTFFIYGKAGCGKSTFIKFLAYNSHVRGELADWAGTRKLVTIGMFFWRSNDPLQKSLEGFYRTIIYHTLGQCPELIPKVFPEQEMAGTLNAVEYQGRELIEAFERLVQHTNSDTHRFCYFIDGLDEYEGTSSDYRRLAEQLANWANSDAVKIICSARPDTIFLKTFTGSGTTVDLGRINRSDLTEFARSRFEDELSGPDYTAGHDICQRLVRDIVRKAEGVFVWAVFVVQSLINGVLEGDDDETSLHERFRDSPTDLNAMFHHMLDRVDSTPHVRRRSNMLLYLVANNTNQRPFHALLCTWLGELGWFQDPACSEFPFDQPIGPHSSPVVKDKRAKAKRLLHLLTQGLLEIQDNTELSTQSSADPYMRYRVDFFHRSVREFLRNEWRFKEAPFPSVADEIQAYCRLYIAEAQFLPNSSIDSQIDARELFETTFLWLADRVRCGHAPPLRHVQQLDRIISDATENQLVQVGRRSPRWDRCFLGSVKIDATTAKRWHNRDGTDCSFLHWAAYWHQGAYVRERLTSGLSIDQVDTAKLNLLLSASVGTDVGLVRYILSQGRHATTPIEIVTYHKAAPGAVDSVSIWMVILRDFVSNVRAYCWKRRFKTIWPPYLGLEWLKRYAEILEAYLQAGADPGVFFLVWPQTPKAEEDASQSPLSPGLCRVNLVQLLDIFKPPNMALLENFLVSTGQGPGMGRENTVNDGFKMSQLARHPSMTLEALFNVDWAIYGVVSREGKSLYGEFSVRVF